MSKSKIVDLKLSEDGTYSPKQVKNKVLNIREKEPTKFGRGEKPKYTMTDEASEFLSGIDVGLDFVEAIRDRAIRIMGLRD